jgi:hypothetical protein
MKKAVHLLRHFFIPHESNNQKAKLLHSSSLSLLIVFLLLCQIVLTNIPKLGPKVLGYAANISPEEVVRLTNEKRIQAGLSPLELNQTLSQAAQAKGTDMLNKGYWAHVAPDGTTPWKFFTDVGYKYRYAGENLARDFSDPSSAVEAWMASLSHRENLLSPKYKEIGVAVVEGNLAGVDTTLIVQFFGSKYSDTLPAVPVAQAKTSQNLPVNPTPFVQPVTSTLPSTSQLGKETSPKILISPFGTTKTISLSLVGILLVVLAIDGVIIAKRRIVRVGGRTFAHLAFLGMILAVAFILKVGRVI